MGLGVFLPLWTFFFLDNGFQKHPRGCKDYEMFVLITFHVWVDLSRSIHNNKIRVSIKTPSRRFWLLTFHHVWAWKNENVCSSRRLSAIELASKKLVITLGDSQLFSQKIFWTLWPHIWQNERLYHVSLCFWTLWLKKSARVSFQTS